MVIKESSCSLPVGLCRLHRVDWDESWTLLYWVWPWPQNSLYLTQAACSGRQKLKFWMTAVLVRLADVNQNIGLDPEAEFEIKRSASRPSRGQNLALRLRKRTQYWPGPRNSGHNFSLEAMWGQHLNSKQRPEGWSRGQCYEAHAKTLASMSN